MNKADYIDVTEVAGEEISQEQLYRLCNRYYWAGQFVQGKDVVEVACGTGPGLQYLAQRARSLLAGDYSPAMVRMARKYNSELNIVQFDAANMPLRDNSVDVVIIFEALYYLPEPERFVRECRRVLRKGGQVLVSNANKDLYDFNPSPYSYVYHGVKELGDLFRAYGFETEFWGSVPLEKVGVRQRLLRPVKKLAVSAGLMPKTMAGKRILKRLVFGRPVSMPAVISEGMVEVERPTPLPPDRPCRDHKVIYCRATMTDKD